MTFEEYLTSKKIDPVRFKRAEPAQFESFEKLFQELHPNSFTAQKLFLINQIRRRFTLKEEATKLAKKPQMKPKIAPRIKK